MWSAVERLQQKTIFSTPASLVNAFTSVSCGCSVIGSVKKNRQSISPSTIREPICWSPPKGPDFRIVISHLISGCFSSRAFLISVPVVPVQQNLCPIRRYEFQRTHSIMSFFIASCATSPILRTIVFIKLNYFYMINYNNKKKLILLKAGG